MVSLEITVIALAFPEIERAFPDTSSSTLSWVLTAYSIGVASFLLIAGWYADALGRKKVFLLGLIIFAIGSVAATVAWTAPVLIGARVVQSIGGAIQYPAGLALLLEAFPADRRQAAIGIWGAMGALAAAAGPTLGGLLVDAFGWRSIFAINLPVALVALWRGRHDLAESTGRAQRGEVDLIGVPLASVGVGVIILGIVQLEQWSAGSPAFLGTSIVGLALLIGFVVRSRRHPAPLLDLRLFTLRSYSVANLGAIAFTIAFFSWLVTLPTFLQEAWGWSIRRTGFAIAPAPFLSMILSPIFGRFADRIGLRVLLMTSAMAGAIGLILHIVVVGSEPDLLLGIVVPGVFIGIAAGAGFSMSVAAIMRDVPPAQFGVAGAARTTIFQLALALGIAAGFAITAGATAPLERLDRIEAVWVLGAAMYAVQFVVYLLAYPDERVT